MSKNSKDLKEFLSYVCVAIYILALIATCAAVWNGVAKHVIETSLAWAAGIHFLADIVIVCLGIKVISDYFKPTAKETPKPQATKSTKAPKKTK